MMIRYARSIVALPAGAGAEPSMTNVFVNCHIIALTTVTAIRPRWGAEFRSSQPHGQVGFNGRH